MSNIFESLERDCPKILDYFGPTSQQLKTIEECSELIQAFAKNLVVIENTNEMIFDNHPTKAEKIGEEIADCIIMLFQMRILFKPSLVDSAIIEKLKRTMKQVDDEDFF